MNIKPSWPKNQLGLEISEIGWNCLLGLGLYGALFRYIKTVANMIADFICDSRFCEYQALRRISVINRYVFLVLEWWATKSFCCYNAPLIIQIPRDSALPNSHDISRDIWEFRRSSPRGFAICLDNQGILFGWWECTVTTVETARNLRQQETLYIENPQLSEPLIIRTNLTKHVPAGTWPSAASKKSAGGSGGAVSPPQWGQGRSPRKLLTTGNLEL